MFLKCSVPIIRLSASHSSLAGSCRETFLNQTSNRQKRHSIACLFVFNHIGLAGTAELCYIRLYVSFLDGRGSLSVIFYQENCRSFLLDSSCTVSTKFSRFLSGQKERF